MYRHLCTLGLAFVLTVGDSSFLHAQFARVPQEHGAGQYSGEPDRSSAPNETGSDLADDRQHGVGRISVAQGDVNVRRGDTSDLVAAATNAPLIAQDRLQTAAGSRAEVELDSANLIRLAPDTDVGLAGLEYRRFQVQLGAGTIIYRVLRPSESQGEVDTPSIALRALGEGAFRIAVLDDGTTQIDVRAGAAEIFGPRGSQRIEPGHSVIVRGNPADPEFLEIEPFMRDQFDDWSEARDRELLSSQSYHYVSRDISGAEDLDANGTWVPSQYGQVWAPRTQGENWAPYSYGQWSWESYYGWTWVDYASWGWAPYHYGRWFWNGNHGWCWWPGARLSAHLWSPALVGFFGWSNGGLGWAALAPYERFQSWWGRGEWGGGPRPYGPDGFYRLRNVGVLGVYRNAAFRGGAVFASYNGFSGPHQRYGFATREQLGGASFIHGQMPVRPNRESYLFSSRQAIANSRFSSVSNLRFFQYRQSQFGGAGQRVGAAGWSHASATSNQNRSLGNVRFSDRQPSFARDSGVDAGRGSPNGWQRFGDPGSSSGYRQRFAGDSRESGWHQFGRPQQSYSANETGQSDRARPMPAYRQPSSNDSFGTYNHGGRPYSGSYGGAPPRGSSAPRYTAPSPPHYSAPPSPHNNGGRGAYPSDSNRHGRR